MMNHRLLMSGTVVALAVSLLVSLTPVDAGRDRRAGDGRLGMMDAQFVHAAALGNMMETDLGELARDKATRADVKAFASRMVEDHSKSSRDLRRLASEKGITLSGGLGNNGRDDRLLNRNDRSDRTDRTEREERDEERDFGGDRGDLTRFGLRHMAVEHQEMRRMLSSLSGEEFDKAYIASQVMGHSKIAAMFELKSKDATDSDVRQFATNTLPTVREHKSMARRLAGLRQDADGPRRR